MLSRFSKYSFVLKIETPRPLSNLHIFIEVSSARFFNVWCSATFLRLEHSLFLPLMNCLKAYLLSSQVSSSMSKLSCTFNLFKNC